MITSNRNGRNTIRLLQSVLSCLEQTKQPQYKFVTHLLGLLLMLPGHATFRNLSRYSPYPDKTFSRWYGSPFDWVSLNKGAITSVVPAEHEQALVMDASFVPKSGTHTYGLDRFWNGSHSRAEKGLEISTLAWLDITDNGASALSLEQTPPSAETPDPEATRMDVYLESQRLYRYYKARFQVEFLFRDAKQFTGLSDCQARSKAKLDFHFNASLSAVTFAKLEARHQNGHGDQVFSMASLKRRAFNQHLVDRICEHLANGQSLEKSSPG